MKSLHNIFLLVFLFTAQNANASDEMHYDKHAHIKVRFVPDIVERKAGTPYDTGKRKGVLKTDMVCIGGKFHIVNISAELYNLKTSVYLANKYKKVFNKIKLYRHPGDPRSRAPALLHIQAHNKVTLYLGTKCLKKSDLHNRKPVYLMMLDVPQMWDLGIK